MNEDQIKTEIRKYFGTRADIKLFNNPVGTGFVCSPKDVARPAPGITILKNARVVDFGLTKGSSDLIGWVSRDGIGKFLALEIKAAHGKPTEDQLNFIEQVKAGGGVAGVVRSVADVEALLNADRLFGK